MDNKEFDFETSEQEQEVAHQEGWLAIVLKSIAWLVPFLVGFILGGLMTSYSYEIDIYKLLIELGVFHAG